MGKWLPDEMMMKVAIENNLSETAFAVKHATNMSFVKRAIY